MGLAPVWKLRGPKREPAPEIRDREKKFGEAPPVASKPPPRRRPPEILPPVPGLVGAARLDLADDRAARILRMDWPELKETVATCQACGLRKTCTQTVFGVGDEKADWLLVGEAPGAEEDARGEPFVGQASRVARTSTSATCSSAVRRATAIRSRSRSASARRTCCASSSSSSRS